MSFWFSIFVVVFLLTFDWLPWYLILVNYIYPCPPFTLDWFSVIDVFILFCHFSLLSMEFVVRSNFWFWCCIPCIHVSSFFPFSVLSLSCLPFNIFFYFLIGSLARVFVGHSIFKGKAALTVEPRAPEFASLDVCRFYFCDVWFFCFVFKVMLIAFCQSDP